MSKSYRKPWGTWVAVKSSAHADKTQAARSVRRAQNHSLRHAIANDVDWDGWLIPERYECSDNNVWGWGRDGKQRPMHPGKQYNNPYAYTSHCSPKTEQEHMVRWFERMKYDDEFIAWASRK